MADTQAASPVYDTIGTNYAPYRRPDRRIAAAIADALGGARSVLDVGSGAGSYEPAGRRVVAVEPSEQMIRQRAPSAAPVARAVAEHLPARDGAFDAALGVLTVHHWTDARAGLAEMRRVSRRQVILTWDREVYASFWMWTHYLPELTASETHLPTAGWIASALDTRDVRVVPIPWDCTDGFGAAYWRRPERYLDPQVRNAISGFWRCDPAAVERAVNALKRDLESGAWHRRFGALLDLDELDCGYRMVVATKPGG